MRTAEARKGGRDARCYTPGMTLPADKGIRKVNGGSRDDALFSLIWSEFERQRDGLELIASENFTSRAVLEATGSVLTNNMPRATLADATTAAAG